MPLNWFYVYVSYSAVNEKTCASLVMSKLKIDKLNQFEIEPIYESSCTLPPYGLHQSGGKIAEDNFGNLYLAVGDFQKGFLSAQSDHHFGKILRIGQDGKTIIFSKGHRNPQGLYWDASSNELIATDHGPQGGDEINLIKRGRDYGWPFVTYGIRYGVNTEGELFSNVGSAHYGNHDGYAKPIYSFLPSIGIKAISRIPTGSYEFPNWLGDYLVASSRAFFRVKIEEGRVIFAEPITELGGIRDIGISDSGIVFASGVNGFIVIKRAKEARG